jgi:hypothetical protein
MEKIFGGQLYLYALSAVCIDELETRQTCKGEQLLGSASNSPIDMVTLTKTAILSVHSKH